MVLPPLKALPGLLLTFAYCTLPIANGYYIVTVRTTCRGSSLYVNLYPVPAKDKLTFAVGLDRTVKTNVYVVDNNGRLVMNVSLTMASGTNNFLLNVNKLPQGGIT